MPVLQKPVMIILGGLPGSGKTTLARVLAARLPAAHLRVDTIEQAILAAGQAPGVLGYAIAQRLAAENLRNGLSVVADSVNPVASSRAGWRAAATEAGMPYLEVEILCSDAALHRSRIEKRVADIPGHRLPDWPDVQALVYEPWRAAVVIDTAVVSVEAAAEDVIARISAC